MSIAHKHPSAKIAELTSLSERTVRRYLHLFQTTGDVEPKRRRYGSIPLFGDFEQLTLLRLILQIQVFTCLRYKRSPKKSLVL